MRKSANLIAAASTLTLLLGSLSLAMIPASVSASASAANAAEGKRIAEDRQLGNCFACHSYEGADLPGNVGPPMIAMKARFPDKARLRAQIADPTDSNPHSMMPPYGKHRILTDEQLDHVVEWVHTL